MTSNHPPEAAIKRSALPILAVAALVSMAAPTARAAEYWFGAVDPVVQRDRHLADPADYMALFADDAPWRAVAAKLSVFEISTQLVMRGQNGELQTVLAALKRRHIKLSGQFGVLIQPPPERNCGPHLEGLGTPQAAETVAARLAAAGGVLDYLDMDEPVVHGHYGLKNECAMSIPEMVDVAATKVAVYRHYFPGVRLGLIEPVNGRFPHLAHETVAFIDQLAQKGAKVEVFTADVAWDSDWRPQFEYLATVLHARHVKVGLFCDGLPDATSDVMWTNEAIANCKLAAADPRIAPDSYFIGTWSRYPKRMLPEDRPGSLTNAALQVMALFH